MMIHIPKMYTLLLKIHLFEIIIKEKENNHFKIVNYSCSKLSHDPSFN